MEKQFGDVAVSLKDYVATMEIQRPPHNFFDHVLICELADALEMLDETPDCRAIVLCAAGKSFCAGANFGGGEQAKSLTKDGNLSKPGELYLEAVRMFSNKKPIIGAIQGAAVGGGLGLALVPDFRVTCPEARFSANFTKLGFHPGFGLTTTLPALVGQQKANMIFYTGRRLTGDTAVEWGLADILTTRENVREEALSLAKEIAGNAPLAVMSTRATMREGLADRVRKQTDHELKEQNWLRQTEDHKEGLRAVSERRAGNFSGR